MSMTKQWLMEQAEHDVDILASEVAQLETVNAELLAALVAVRDDICDEHSQAWLSPHVARQVRAVIDLALRGA